MQVSPQKNVPVLHFDHNAHRNSHFQSRALNICDFDPSFLRNEKWKFLQWNQNRTLHPNLGLLARASHFTVANLFQSHLIIKSEQAPGKGPASGGNFPRIHNIKIHISLLLPTSLIPPFILKVFSLLSLPLNPQVVFRFFKQFLIAVAEKTAPENDIKFESKAIFT